LWLQGGPGCSSLLGLFNENGPLRQTTSGGLTYTDLSWTRNANMLYLDSPAGVGFSYSNTTSDYNTNDNKTAADSYVFLQRFMEQYPQFKGRDLWIAGESYGGVYVPMLTDLVVTHHNTSLYTQLTGMMTGNPVFRCDSLIRHNQTGWLRLQFNLLYWHGLVSYRHYANWTRSNCELGNVAPDVCSDIFNVAVQEIGEIDQQLVKQQASLDPDDLYQDFCIGNGTLQFAKNIPGPNCKPIGNLLISYLNQPAVQKVIGARPTDWTICTGRINYTASVGSINPFYLSIFDNKPSANVLVYSGDVDIMTVPFAITQACLFELQRPRKTSWTPWFVNGATAGYWESFNGYTHATIKGAGHEVPLYQPLLGLNMFTRFLKTGSLKGDGPQAARRAFPRPLTQGSILRSLNIH